MLLRSSSTPVLGSLLPSSYHETPNNNNNNSSEINNIARRHFSPVNFHRSSSTQKLSPFHHQTFQHGPPMISPSISRNNGVIRRSQSEGNLQGLLSSSVSRDGCDEFDGFSVPKKPFKSSSKQPRFPVMQTIPSFSFRRSKHRFVDEEEYSYYADSEEEEEESDPDEEGGMENHARNRDWNSDDDDDDVTHTTSVSAATHPGQVVAIGLGSGEVETVKNDDEVILSKMHLAIGLGAGAGYCGGNFGGGGRSECKVTGYNGDGGGGGRGDGDVEEYYKRMVEENPRNPLFLSNYAHFLYQKKDLEGAEGYYARSILEDPTDGDVLCNYAKVIWELQADQGRALSYFERAVQASPQDSHVAAAYASFLWEMDEAEDQGEVQRMGTIEKDVERMDPFLYVSSVS